MTQSTPKRLAQIAQAFRFACELDVAVRKPGNVSLASPGHRMTAALFSASAAAATAPLCRAGARVGDRIEGAMAATWQVAGCNTNLGILLLCAPLAAAAERLDGPITADGLHRAVIDVIAGLDRDDAAAAFRAIALANPAGLGRADKEDVHTEPTQSLREAMTLAADRDSVARQYRDGYADLFGLGLQALRCGSTVGGMPRCDEYASPGDGDQLPTQPAVAMHAAPTQPAWAALAARAAPDLSPRVQRTYLALLANTPDSHIARKWGLEAANAILQEAQPWAARAAAGEAVDDDARFAAWDESLKLRGINPGTTADLTVATLMIGSLSGQLTRPVM